MLFRFFLSSMVFFSASCYSSDDDCNSYYLKSLKESGFISLSKYFEESDSVKKGLSDLDEYSGMLSYFKEGRGEVWGSEFNRLTVSLKKEGRYFSYDYNALSKKLGRVKVKLLRKNNGDCALVSISLDYR